MNPGAPLQYGDKSAHLPVERTKEEIVVLKAFIAVVGAYDLREELLHKYIINSLQLRSTW
jgi:hypothetical protein